MHTIRRLPIAWTLAIFGMYAADCGADLQATQAPAAGMAIINGEVQRHGDGASAPSIDVWASDTATRREVSRDLTDANGRFSLSVPPGRYTIAASRPGFLESRYGSLQYGLPGAPLVVTAGQREEIRLVIHRAPVVTGVVRDDHGVPIVNAAVAFFRPPIQGGATRQVGSRVTTDANGAYRSDGLLPGEYVAVAMAPRPVDSGSGDVRFRTPAAQFFPGSDSQAQAGHFRLDPDEERTGVDFTLPRRPLTTLKGVVMPPENVKLLDDVVVIVSGADDSPPTWDAPRMVGRSFVLPLHPGRYRVDVRAVGSRVDQPPQRDGRLYFSTTFIDVDDALPTMVRELQLRESLRVSGHVRALDGPISTVGIRLLPAVPRQAAIRPVEVPTLRDGHLSADGVAPGRYRVELVDSDGPWVLDSVRFRGQSGVGAAIDIDAPVGADELELLVAPTTASLSGRLLRADETPSSYVIGLLPLDRTANHAWPVSFTRADNAGGYLFSRQRPGSYLLFLLRDPDVAFLESTTLLDDLRNNPAAGTRVALTAGAETKQDLRIAAVRYN
jgi:hypothetical protein